MANPETKSVTADQWNLIGENVTAGTIVNENNLPGRYTFVATGDDAPADLTVASIPSEPSTPVSHDSYIDVYFYPVGRSGNITVMF